MPSSNGGCSCDRKKVLDKPLETEYKIDGIGKREEGK